MLLDPSQVNVAAQGSGPLASEEVIELFCGNGEQILAWVGQAACQRLAFNRGARLGGGGGGSPQPRRAPAGS